MDAAIPVVLFNRYVPDSHASSIVADNHLGGELVANHLLDTGHQRLAYIAGDENSSTNQDREAGFRSALDTARAGSACTACGCLQRTKGGTGNRVSDGDVATAGCDFRC